MKIVIGADLVPTNTNEALFAAGDVKTLIGDELKAILDEADCRIFNLEVPLSDVRDPIKKCGPNLAAPAAAIVGYKAMDVDVLTLANNHILDQGECGLLETCRLLRENDIHHLGAGSTPEDAAEPYLFACGGKRIGIYACVDHEFSVVTEDNAGANPFDFVKSFDHVSALKEQCDYVIVLHHGGKEHYRYPSPDLQKTCRHFVDKGADLVICQHSHCIGCEEEYNGGTIVYGQGNFLFDHSSSEYWKTSLLIQLDEQLNVSYLPLVKADNTVRLADKEQARQIMADFKERSEQIKQPGFVRKHYEEYAKGMLEWYLMILSGTYDSIWAKILNVLKARRLLHWLIMRRYGKHDLRVLRNHIECEAHRELLLAALKGEN